MTRDIVSGDVKEKELEFLTLFDQVKKTEVLLVSREYFFFPKKAKQRDDSEINV